MVVSHFQKSLGTKDRFISGFSAGVSQSEIPGVLEYLY